MTNQPALSEKELLQSIEFNAKKLAVLLHHSTMPNEVKDAWIALLPNMSIKQMDQLLNILEAKYLDEKTKDIDEEYKKELEKIVKAFENTRNEDHKKLLEKINKLG